jgi:hypothetical protein
MIDSNDIVDFIIWKKGDSDIAICYLREILAANKISKDLIDKFYLLEVVQRIILTEALFRFGGVFKVIFWIGFYKKKKKLY